MQETAITVILPLSLRVGNALSILILCASNTRRRKYGRGWLIIRKILPYAIRIPKRYTPLSQLEYEFKTQRMDGIQLAFALIIELWKLINYRQQYRTVIPKAAISGATTRSQKIRSKLKGIQASLWESNWFRTGACFIYQEKIHRYFCFGIGTAENLWPYPSPEIRRIKRTEQSVSKKNPAKLKPLREDLKTARSITERYPHILKLLETERAMEIQVKTKERNYERWKTHRKIFQ